MGLIMSEGLYEVYVCKHNDEIVYIGSGKHGRHKHCVSGVSQNYGLNKLHFSDPNNVKVEILMYVNTKAESFEVEKSLIKLHKPIYNDVFVTNTRNDSSSIASTKRKQFKELMDSYNIKGLNRHKLIKLYDDFFELYSINDIIQNRIKILPYQSCINANWYSVAQLSKYLRNVDSDVYTAQHYCGLFCECFVEVFNYDLMDSLVDFKGKSSWMKNL